VWHTLLDPNARRTCVVAVLLNIFAPGSSGLLLCIARPNQRIMPILVVLSRELG
jgi:hypothetical protein